MKKKKIQKIIMKIMNKNQIIMKILLIMKTKLKKKKKNLKIVKLNKKI